MFTLYGMYDELEGKKIKHGEMNLNIVDVLTYLCANRSNWACVLSFPSLDARALDGRRITVIETTRIESRSIIDLISCILYVCMYMYDGCDV